MCAGSIVHLGGAEPHALRGCTHSKVHPGCCSGRTDALLARDGPFPWVSVECPGRPGRFSQPQLGKRCPVNPPAVMAASEDPGTWFLQTQATRFLQEQGGARDSLQVLR